MYAVIETGGKQYRVEVGTELEVELLDGEPGDSITIDRVLLVVDGDDSAIGHPVVADAGVEAEVVRRDRTDKVISFKYRPKARSRVKKGHRQELTVLRIADITFGGKSAAKTAEKAERDAKTERERLEEAATAQAAKDAELAAKATGAKAETKSETAAKAKAEPKGKTETTTKAKADAKPAAGTKTTTKAPDASSKTKAETKGAATKPASAKADSPAKADAPKKPRTTKKDE